MATFILASCLFTSVRDEQGNKFSIPMENINQIVTNIDKFTPKKRRFVFIANDPTAYQDNDMRGKVLFESFDKTGLGFKEYIVLDGRNENLSSSIIKDADLIFISGGKILCENEFLNKINFKKLLTGFNGLVIGTSAGAMNLCKTICNFPEEIADLQEPRLVNGLGVSERYLIPHFDGKNCKYEFSCEEFDIVKDYILPYSFKFELTALTNGAYILLNDNKEKIFGEYSIIKDGKVKVIENSK